MCKRCDPKPEPVPPPLRTCKGCGVPERVNAAGYSNISPYLGYCGDCIRRAYEAPESVR